MADDDSEEVVLNLKILSPSTEVQSDITLADLPAATTIQELRERIRNEIESRPAVDRMRLIYRGRVMMRDTDTLLDVFGLTNIRESKNQTLHMVLKELPSTDQATPSTAPRSSTAPPHNPSRGVTGISDGPHNPANPFQPSQQPRPNSQPPPYIPHHPHPLAHHLQQHQAALAQGLPPHLQQHLGQHPAHHQAAHVAYGPGPPLPHSGNGSPVAGQGLPIPPLGPATPINPAAPHFLPGTTQTIRQGVGPNGERWTVTNTTVALPAHNPPQPPHTQGSAVRRPTSPRRQSIFALPRVPTQHPPVSLDLTLEETVQRVGQLLRRMREELESARLLLQPAPEGEGHDTEMSRYTAEAGFSMAQNRAHVIEGHLDTATRFWVHLQDTFAGASPSIIDNPGIRELRQSANLWRQRLLALTEALPSQTQNEPGNTSSQIQTQSESTSPQTQTNSESTPLANTGPELFILSSPQGPVGILFDQRGTFSTAPMVQTLPFQSFTQQFQNNRQVLAGLGQQMVQTSAQIQNQIAVNQLPQPNPADQAAPAPANQPQAPAQPAAPEQDRVMVIFGHAWLIVKLIFFMYFFAGGGSWYRPIMLGIVAAVVYLANLGIFEGQFDAVRRHFEALLPIPGQINAQNPDQAPNADANAEPPAPGQPARGRRVTPEEAAQRLVQQAQERRNGRFRDTFRGLERAVALFVASLWPGIGERMVHAQEERDRAIRELIAAREQQEREEREAREEAEKKKDEEKVSEAAEDSSDSANVTAEGSSRKGKERAQDVEGVEDSPVTA